LLILRGWIGLRKLGARGVALLVLAAGAFIFIAAYLYVGFFWVRE
jgi:hypothetical protein